MASLRFNGQPHAVGLAAALAQLTVTAGDKTVLAVGNTDITQPAAILRFIARSNPQLYGSNDLQRAEADHWIDVAVFHISSKADHATTIARLTDINNHLQRRTYLLGNEHQRSIADAAVFGALLGNQSFAALLVKNQLKDYVELVRWYDTCRHHPAFAKLHDEVVAKAMQVIKTGGATEKKVADPTKGGRFIELEGAEMGKVVTRFPPEASGYLHIGHAKAAMLNQYFARTYKGKLIMRFDDTNPAKENAEFEKVILEDLEMLQIKPDVFSHTSDHFDKLLDYMTQLLKEGKAYVDDTPSEEMGQQRLARQKSRNRDNSVEKNLQLWEEMKKGSEIGQKCVTRAKIDYSSVNGALRDPTLYRCKPEPHVRTGAKYKVYPTYDFACPIVDSVEGVTHTLRTTEYHDRDEQYAWVCKAVNLRLPRIWDFSRLNLVYTVMSKRQLTWFVQNKYVDGWDDPRFPTVRGILRHGMTVDGLRNFILSMGSSKTQVQMEWDIIWSFNKKVIDPVAPRHVALEAKNLVRCSVSGVNGVESATVQLHPKDPAVGTKTQWRGPSIWLEQADAASLKVGDRVTLVDWGNAVVEAIEQSDKGAKFITGIKFKFLAGDNDFKSTVKLTFLADAPEESLVDIAAVEYTSLITKPFLAKGEDYLQFVAPKSKFEIQLTGAHTLANLQQGEIVQVQRKGFFICDKPYNPLLKKPLVLIYIPDGHAKTFIADREPSGRVVSAAEYSSMEQEIAMHKRNIVTMKKSKADKEDVRKAEARLKELEEALSQVRVAGTDVQGASPAAVTAAASADTAAELHPDAKNLLTAVHTQGDMIREMKAKGADKTAVQAEVQKLKELKEQYKQLTGQEPPAAPSGDAAAPAAKKQSAPAAKKEAAPAKKEAAPAKKEEKKEAKKEAAPVAAALTSLSVAVAAAVPAAASSAHVASGDAAAQQLQEKVHAQGEKVRALKAAKAAKPEIDAAVAELLKLKGEYKTLTGHDVPAQAGAPAPRAAKEPKEPKAEAAPKAKPAKTESAAKPAKTDGEETEGGKTRLGLEVGKAEDFAEWYSQIITKAELIEYYDVSGCYVLRPWSYALWEAIKEFFDAEIKKRGVENAYFPIFVSQAALEREKEHIADFAPEVAWVTRSGQSELDKPIAIRPTSETVMYPSFASWVQSHRDLPIKINQWNNVVRWEFKQPTPFLRTREFLWQEGHTAFATKPPAEEEVLDILDLYRRVYEELLAIPVVPGRKTEKEKFAGGDYTTTVEAYIAQNGRAIQGATSHHLGQNFSKMFGIKFQDPADEKNTCYAYQNSWGITTRTIGVMIMVHGDDKGLVLPPRAASVQVIIIATGLSKKLSDEGRKKLYAKCQELERTLSAAGIRARADIRDNYSPPWKYNHYELKGVPLRLELGPRDLETNSAVLVRRVDGEKSTVPLAELGATIKKMLEDIHDVMFAKALRERDNHLKQATEWSQVQPLLNSKCLVLMPFCGAKDCEGNIKTDTTGENPADPKAPAMGAKSLCIPFKQPDLPAGTKCLHSACSSPAKYWTMFGRSY